MWLFGPSERRGGEGEPRILLGFGGFGKGGGASNPVFFLGFGPSERADKPQTLHLFQRFWAFGKAAGASKPVFYLGLVLSEWAFGKGGEATNLVVCKGLRIVFSVVVRAFGKGGEAKRTAGVSRTPKSLKY